MAKIIIATPELITIFRTYMIEGALPEHCWIWTGGTNRSGYGHFTLNGEFFLAPRASYAIYNGALSEHLEVRHTCDNRICVNPNHLIEGTHLENVRDMVNRGRGVYISGEAHYRAKLQETDIPQIKFKAALGLSERALAREYKVSKRCIQAVLSGETWKNIP